MRVRKLSTTGDYTFGQGQLNFFIDDPEGVAQVVKTSLLLWLGEWYLNLEAGVPYFQGILGKHPQATADSTIQDAVMGVTVIDNQGNTVQAVRSIENYSSTLDPINRSLSVSMTLNTIYGPTALQMENYVNY